MNRASARSGPRWAREAVVSLAFAGCAVAPSGCAGKKAAVAASDAQREHARADARCSAWADWDRYAEAFIEADGRVVDRTAGARTTSEGQAYALALALVAGDRARFSAVLHWTDVNLAGAALGERLPAWLWSSGPKGFAIADANAASDADLWLAWALLEAGRLWNEPRYEALGDRLLIQVRTLEIVDLPGLGLALLPAPHGFLSPEAPSADAGSTAARVARLNPSYVPLPLLRRFADRDPRGPWSALAQSWDRLLHDAAPNGLVPDWIAQSSSAGVFVDPVSGSVGSYDAIRTILWAAFIDEADPLRASWQRSTRGLADWYRATGRIPERVDTRAPAPSKDGSASAGSVDSRGLSGHEGPPGFWAAILPSLAAQGDVGGVAALRERLEHSRGPSGNFGEPAAYYDQNLALFALGFLDGAFRFSRDGRLQPRWTSCAQP